MAHNDNERFSSSSLNHRLKELSNSQHSIETLSLWIIRHKRHAHTSVEIWAKEIYKASPTRKLTLLFLANDIVQNSKKRGIEFITEFAKILPKAIEMTYKDCDLQSFKEVSRIIDIWEERNCFNTELITALHNIKQHYNNTITTTTINNNNNNNNNNNDNNNSNNNDNNNSNNNNSNNNNNSADYSINDSSHTAEAGETGTENTIELAIDLLEPTRDPPDYGELISALYSSEHQPSNDTRTQQDISNSVRIFQDPLLVPAAQDAQDIETLIQKLGDAQNLILGYTQLLDKELLEKRQLQEMLVAFLVEQKSLLGQSEEKKSKQLARQDHVSTVRSELVSHIANLPDFLGGLDPLPSVGDLFQYNDALN